MKKDVRTLITDYLASKKIADKEIISKIDIESVLKKGLIEALKKSETIQLGDFGLFKKVTRQINEERIKTIDFFPNTGIDTKLSKKFSSTRKEEMGKQKKLKRLIMVLLLLLLFSGGLIAATILLSPQLKTAFDSISLNNKDASADSQEITNDMVIRDTSGDSNTIILNNQDNTIDPSKVKDEVIDLKNNEIVTNKDQSLIIKTQTVNDTNLKRGQYTSTVVEIDGKLYDKYIYVIKEGDELNWLSLEFLGDRSKWPTIHKDNPYIKNPHLIYPDFKLTIYKLRK